MQAKKGSRLCWYVSIGLLFLALVVLLQPVASHAAPPGADTVVYVVKPGDTLRSIAAANGTTISAIVHANNMSNPDVIYPGQRLMIPVRGGVAPGPAPIAPKPAPAPTAAPKLAAGASVYHMVKLGDTLEKIARAYGTTAAAISAANGITNPDLIWVGQKLLVRGATQPGAPAPKPTAKRQPQSGGSAPATVVKPTKFVVSISQQRCWLYAGDALIAKWVCSTGRRSSPTVPGTYRIQSKLPKAWGSRWGFWMPYWLGIYWAGGSENGIHGLPWNPKTGVQVWTGSVGRPITFGCVMLDNVNAKMLYNAAWIGMPVIIKP